MMEGWLFLLFFKELLSRTMFNPFGTEFLKISVQSRPELILEMLKNNSLLSPDRAVWPL